MQFSLALVFKNFRIMIDRRIQYGNGFAITDKTIITVLTKYPALPTTALPGSI